MWLIVVPYYDHCFYFFPCTNFDWVASIIASKYVLA